MFIYVIMYISGVYIEVVVRVGGKHLIVFNILELTFLCNYIHKEGYLEISFNV